MELKFAALALCVSSTWRADAQPAPQIPIRTLTPAINTDSGVISIVSMIRVLSDGRVLLNDAIRHRVLLFDTTLKNFTVIADTGGQSRQTFGSGSGGLLAYPGDSTFFIDQSSQALLMIDPQGHIGRVMSPIKTADVRFLTGSVNGVPKFDDKGRLYYRGEAPQPRIPAVDANVGKYFEPPDSAPIIRADFDRRTLDTVAYLKVARYKIKLVRYLNGFAFQSLIDPLPGTDEWAVLADGTVAIIRNHDYHVDWIRPDGKTESSPKMPFDWRRLTDDEKVRMVDSTRRLIDSTLDARFEQLAKTAAEQGRTLLRESAPIMPQEVVKPSEMLDYIPPVRPGIQVRVDLDGNLWVLPSTSSAAKGGSLFDVVNRKGEVIERVQLPRGRNLHGFAPGGVIYMSVPSSTGWVRLERARIIRP
jgi:hypothetical protein